MYVVFEYNSSGSLFTQLLKVSSPGLCMTWPSAADMWLEHAFLDMLKNENLPDEIVVYSFQRGTCLYYAVAVTGY